MLSVLFSSALGYFLGCLSPAAFLSKVKKTDLREKGTKNLGATNTMVVMGVRYGVAVMVFDVLKAFAASRLARMLFPQLAVANWLAGTFAVIGHVHPFYLKFRGGKGVACLAGMILGTDPILLTLLLPIAIALMLLVNYGYAGPISAGVLFPVIAGVRSGEITVFFIALIAGGLVIVRHMENIDRAKAGEEMKFRSFFSSREDSESLDEHS